MARSDALERENLVRITKHREQIYEDIVDFAESLLIELDRHPRDGTPREIKKENLMHKRTYLSLAIKKLLHVKTLENLRCSHTVINAETKSGLGQCQSCKRLMVRTWSELSE